MLSLTDAIQLLEEATSTTSWPVSTFPVTVKPGRVVLTKGIALLEATK